jgi:4-hydroxybenzoate polyprenyltransferase
LSRLVLYARLVRLDKPVGIWLLLWPTLTGLWLAAAGPPRLKYLLVFIAGTVLMRSAGCALNDAADATIDRHVKRTAARVVAQGAVSRREAVAVSAVLAAAAAALLPLLNWASFWVALLALFVALSYPLFKRFFPLPQAWLGIAFSMGIPLAFVALQGRVPATAGLLFAANLFYVVGYDTIYAMVDRDDDLRLGVHSSAIFFGRFEVLAVRLCYAAYLGLLLVLGGLLQATWPYYAALGGASLLAQPR